MTGRTGQTCPRSGLWAAQCCGYQIALSKGETFPPCGGYHGAVIWVLKRPT